MKKLSKMKETVSKEAERTKALKMKQNRTKKVQWEARTMHLKKQKKENQDGDGMRSNIYRHQ